MLIKLEYIWVDSEDTLRGKTKIWDLILKNTLSTIL